MPAPPLSTILTNLYQNNLADIDPRDIGSLKDAFAFSTWEDAPLEQILNRLILLLSQSPDREKGWLLTNTIKEGLRKSITINPNFEPILPFLKLDTDPAYLAMLISCIGATNQKQYRPLVEPFIEHEDALLRRYALEAYIFMKW